MTRGEIMRGLSMTMTLQNVIKPGSRAANAYDLINLNENVTTTWVQIIKQGNFATINGSIYFSDAITGTIRVASVPYELRPASRYYFKGGNGNFSQSPPVNGYLDSNGDITVTLSGQTYFYFMIQWAVPNEVINLKDISDGIVCEGKIAVIGNSCVYHDRLVTSGLTQWNSVGVIPEDYKLLADSARVRPFVKVIGSPNLGYYRDSTVTYGKSINVFMYDGETYDIDGVWLYR